MAVPCLLLRISVLSYTCSIGMGDLSWEKYPDVSAVPRAREWLGIQADLGLAGSTLDAYARGLSDFLQFLGSFGVPAEDVSRVHIAQWIGDLARRPNGRSGRSKMSSSRGGLATATIAQRLTAVRLFYEHLVTEGVRTANPVGRGRYTPGKALAGRPVAGLVRHREALPWIPTEAQWQALVAALRTESIRNRFMFMLAYDAGLRREELCTLQTSDLDPARRLVTVRAEATKRRARGRVVPYSTTTNLLYRLYLEHRRELSNTRGPLFLSESRRNRAQPITLSTWSKAIEGIARRAGVSRFSTHTLRHLCLTDLARSGWSLVELAQFAGHRQPQTTLQYIHISGRDLAAKFDRGMAQIHTWRARTMAEPDA
jgi:integrase/recombinase XerD